MSETVRAEAPAGAPRWERGTIAAVGLGSALVVWYLTGSRGLGLTSDSIAYVGTADSIVRGDGFGYVLQDPLTSWPLLYPLLLAGVGKGAGLDALSAGRVIAIVLAAAMVLAMWFLLRRVVRQPAIRVAAAVAVGFAPATISLENHLLSDALFSVGTIVFVVVLHRVVARPAGGWVALAVGLASVLFLTRYIGAGFVLVAAFVIAVTPIERRWRDRLVRAIAFGVASAIVPVAYAWRLNEVSGSFLGQDRTTTAGSGFRSLTVIPQAFSTWVFTRSRAGAAGTIAGLVVLMAIGACAVWLVIAYRRSAQVTRSAGQGLPTDDSLPVARAVLALFWLGSLGYVVALRAIVFFDLDARTLAMLFPLSVAVIAAAVDELSRAARSPLPVLLRGGMALWAVALLGIGIHDGLTVRTRGSGYTDRQYDDTFAELRSTDLALLLPPNCGLRSNQPNLLYLVGKPSRFTPLPIAMAPSNPRATEPLQSSDCVIWFAVGQPGMIVVPIEELGRQVELLVSHRTTTFTIYRVAP